MIRAFNPNDVMADPEVHESVRAFLDAHPEEFPNREAAEVSISNVINGLQESYKGWRFFRDDKLRRIREEFTIRRITDLSDPRLLGFGEYQDEDRDPAEAIRIMLARFPIDAKRFSEYGFDLHDTPQQEFIRKCLDAAGIDVVQAALLCGLKPRSFKPYLASDGSSSFRRMQYPVFFTFLTKIRI